jgi:hypothetical protein
VALERHPKPICGDYLSRADTPTISSDARSLRRKGCRVGVQTNSLAAAPLPLLGALAHACGAGRLAYEPCGRQSEAGPGRAGPAFRHFEYLTSPLHLTAEDARTALEKAGWFAGSEVTW